MQSGGSGIGRTTCTSASTPARLGLTPSSANSMTHMSRLSFALSTYLPRWAQLLCCAALCRVVLGGVQCWGASLGCAVLAHALLCCSEQPHEGMRCCIVLHEAMLCCPTQPNPAQPSLLDWHCHAAQYCTAVLAVSSWAQLGCAVSRGQALKRLLLLCLHSRWYQPYS